MPGKRLFWTMLIVAAAAAAVAGPVDRVAHQYAERSLKSALVTFAIARAMNGVISAAQGSEVALEPGGVGVVLSVGEVLDPVNDLVERFSAVMLTAASSLGLQLIILEISGWWGITLALVAVATVAVAGLWAPPLMERRFVSLALRFLVVFLFVRFAVPLLIIATTMVSDTFLEDQQREITAALETASTEIEAIGDEVDRPDAAAGRSFSERIGALFDTSLDSLRIGARLDALREKASQVSEHIVKLIAIFVLQTILMPIGFLWLLLEAMKGLAARTARYYVEGAGTRGLPQ
jgi:hypothetical protein